MTGCGRALHTMPMWVEEILRKRVNILMDLIGTIIN